MSTESYKKVKQYLAGLEDRDFIRGYETHSSYSTGAKVFDLYTPSVSEYVTQHSSLNCLAKDIPEISNNPLRFIATKTSAEIFTQHAREQITQIEQQKKLREQFCSIEKEVLLSNNEEIEWSATLEKWKSKRSSELNKNSLPLLTATKIPEKNRVEKNRIIPILDSKEEILTITSPSADEYTDSGIENNRFTPTPHSPSTSTDLSPRSDKNPTDVQDSHSHSHIVYSNNRFLQTRASPEDVPPPLPINPPPSLSDEDEHVIKNLNVEKRNIDPTNSRETLTRTGSQDSLKLDQVVVGLTLHRDPSDSELNSILAERETIFKTTSTTSYLNNHRGPLNRSTISAQLENNTPKFITKETTASFNCQKTYEEQARVDAVVAQQDHDTASKQIKKESKLWKQKLMKDIPLEISSPTMLETKKADLARDKATKTVSVGVEVCREQNAKVSAFKFPHKSNESVVFTVKSANKMAPQGSHLRAVDIPFDDTETIGTQKLHGLAGGNLPDANGLLIVRMKLNSSIESSTHGFGFSVKGGKEHNEPLTVDTVLVNTPADHCGLQIGDVILNINGESTFDKYIQTAMRMLNEATRLGEVEMQLQRISAPFPLIQNSTNQEIESPLTKTPSFDDKRIIFERKPSETNSYYEFKQKKTIYRFEGVRASDSVGKPSGSVSSISPQSSKSSDYGHDSKESDFSQSLHRRSSKKMSRSGSPDYRVVSLNEKPDPGKLDDFVPEVERDSKIQRPFEDAKLKIQRVPSRKTDEPKLIRNFDLNLVKSSNESLHSTKRRDSFPKEEVGSVADGDKENETASNIERPVVFDESDVVHVIHRVPEMETIELVQEFKRYPENEFVSKEFVVDKKESSPPYEEPEPDYHQEISTLRYKNAELIDMPSVSIGEHIENEENFDDDIYAKIEEPKERRSDKEPIFPKTSEPKVFIVQHKVPISPSQSPKRITYEYMREREEEHYENIEDGDGYTIPQLHSRQNANSYQNLNSYQHSPRNAEAILAKNRPVYRREVPIYIERKTQATNTLPSSSPYNRHAVHYSTIYSPPPYERNYEDEANVSRVTYRFYDRNMREVNPATRISKVDRARRATRSFDEGLDVFGRNINYSPQNIEDRQIIESRNTREWRQFIREQRLPNPGHTSSLNRIDADSKFQIVHKPTIGVTNISPTSRPIIKTVQRNSSEIKHQTREIPVQLETASYALPQKPNRHDESTSTQSGDEPIMSVSGKHRCAHCNQELGRGAAMIIESLSLFYHLSCFRCYVCNIPLGSGTKGADVRVRDTKLHCQKCYSNDEVGMKFSQI